MSRSRIFPVVWEYSDIDISNSNYRSYRRYVVIIKILMATQFESELVKKYKKEDSGFDYDVDIKFERMPSNDKMDFDEYTKVSFKTSYMDDFKYMVSFPLTTRYYTEDIFSQYQIRSNAGHILDAFFTYYGNVEGHLITNGMSADFPGIASKDIDPLDDIGINFEDNPEYLNGGYDFYSPAVNDFIVSLDRQSNIYSDSVSRYPGATIDDGFDNDKIKNLINNWIELYNFAPNDIDIQDAWFNGIFTFYNNIINHYEADVKYDINGISIIKRSKRVWEYPYDVYHYRTKLEILNVDGSISVLDFGHNFLNYDGTLAQPYNDTRKNSIVDTFLYNRDETFKKMVELNYITIKLVNKRCRLFIELFKEKHIPFPENYIDKMNTIFSFDITKEKKLGILETCGSLVTNMFNDVYVLYFDYVYPLCDFFLQYIINDEIYTIRRYTYVCMPFEFVIDGFTYDSVEKNYRVYCDTIERSIQLLYSLKWAWVVDGRSLLTNEILLLCKSYNRDLDTSNFNDQNGMITAIQSQLQYRIIMFINIISKLSMVNDPMPTSLPMQHRIFDILKLYAVYRYIYGYRYPTTSELQESQDNNTRISYCGRISTNVTSYQPINLVNIVGMLTNKIIKDPTNKDLYITTITIINRLIGGVFVLHPTGKYDDYIKMFSFFLLCTDRYDLDVMKRFDEFVEKGANFMYGTICGVDFINTIKETITTKLIPMAWENKLSIEVFDNIDPMIEPLINNSFRWGVSKELLYDVKHNLTTYLDGV